MDVSISTWKSLFPELQTEGLKCQCGRAWSGWRTFLERDFVGLEASTCECGMPGAAIMQTRNVAANERWIQALSLFAAADTKMIIRHTGVDKGVRKLRLVEPLQGLPGGGAAAIARIFPDGELGGASRISPTLAPGQPALKLVVSAEDTLSKERSRVSHAENCPYMPLNVRNEST